jgi:hypothetical protein
MIDFSIDFSTAINNVLDWFGQVIAMPPNEAAWYLLWRGGWLLPLLVLAPIVLSWRADKRKSEFSKNIEYVLLAIEPPKNNDQVLTAVEKIFLSLTSTFAKVTEWEKLTKGKFNPPYSFEIVSLDSYIQFIVRVQRSYAEYVSALFYAQYPECRVFEVTDYAERIPTDFSPTTGTHDCWTTEFVLTKSQFVPIRTYSQNTTNFNAKNPTVFDTPFANLLEVLSRLKRGEMIGVQIVATPTDDKWQEDGWKFLKELLGEKPKSQTSLFSHIIVFLATTISGLIQSVVSTYEPGPAEVKKEEKKSEPKTNLEKNMLQGVENKISKPGYQSVVRVLYAARKEVFNKARGVTPLMGAIKQFSGLNAFKPGTKGSLVGDKGWTKKTKANNLAKSQTKLIKRYKSRAAKGLDGSYILNVEELTSLFHLPISGIRAPMISRVAAKTAEPPSALPVELLEAEGLGMGELPPSEAELESQRKSITSSSFPESKIDEVQNSNSNPNSSNGNQDEPPSNLPFMLE